LSLEQGLKKKCYYMGCTAVSCIWRWNSPINKNRVHEICWYSMSMERSPFSAKNQTH